MARPNAVLRVAGSAAFLGAACSSVRPVAAPPPAAPPAPALAIVDAGPPVVDAAPKLPAIPVTWISARRNNTCAIRGGRVYCWGVGFSGRGWSAELRPVRIGTYEHAEAVTVGGQLACVLEGGGVTCWGYNGAGEVGDGTTTERLQPVQVLGLTRLVTSIEANGSTVCAIVNGAVSCWGALHGPRPKRVTGLRPPVTAIAVGSSAACAASDATEVFCWGSPTIHRTPLNILVDLSEGLSVTPKRLSSPQDAGVGGVVTAMTGGSAYLSSIGIIVDGALQTWMPLATQRSSLPLRGITSASIGGEQTCVIADGEVTCWREFDSTPIHVKLPGRATMITSGDDHHCALVDGEAYCWGSRGYPALGDGEPLCVPDWCWNSNLKPDGGLAPGTSCLEPPKDCRQDNPVRVPL